MRSKNERLWQGHVSVPGPAFAVAYDRAVAEERCRPPALKSHLPSFRSDGASCSAHDNDETGGRARRKGGLQLFVALRADGESR